MAAGVSGVSFTLSANKHSIKGGDKLTISSSQPLPAGEHYLMLAGSRGSDRVPMERVNATCLSAILPGHKTAETVKLSLHMTGDDSTLYSSPFSYVTEQALFFDHLLQSLKENGSSLPKTLPPLTSPEAHREFDQSLVSTLRNSAPPTGWSLVGTSDGQKETLLHFAVRHGLNSLSQHLLSVPGADKAILLPDQQGQLPIDIAREQGNEGLAQLLTLFMNEVEANGVGGDSPFESPQHPPMRGRSNVKVVQDLEKFKVINTQWTNQVKRYRHSSHNSLTSLDCPPTLTNGSTPSHPPTHHIPVRRRRSSVAVMDVGEVPYVPATPLEVVQVNTRDPELAVMERSRKSSWSRVVGSSDCRSLGTGLNELDRISAEEAIRDRLVQVKTELVQLDKKRQDSAHSNHHLKITGAQLGVMYRLSHSCPSLNDEDNFDESEAPSAFLSAATSPGGRTASPLSPQSPQSSSLEEVGYHHPPDHTPIRYLVTTDDVTTPDSNKVVSRQTCSESKLLEKDRLSTSDSSPRSTVSTGALTEESSINVEESIVEHRQLTQAGSPVSSELTVRSEDDYVLVSSNVSKEASPIPPDSEPPSSQTVSDLQTPVGTPSNMIDVPVRIPTPVRSLGRVKHHRRSLSSSEVEIMSSVGTLTGIEIATPSSTGWNTPTATPITCIEEDRLSAQNSAAELDERSRASSLLTNDTCSLQESDTSDDECGSGRGVVTMTEPFPPLSISPSIAVEMEESTDSVPAVRIRDPQKRERLRASHTNRYSADFIITGIVDGYPEEEQAMPTTIKKRNNSSNLADAMTLSQEMPILDPTPIQHVSPTLLDTSEVFANPADLSPSDIELSFKSGENSLESSHSSTFFKSSGSPKTIKKRKGKSPLISRRKTIGPTKIDDKGLTKEKVGPTINALKDLMKSPDRYSDGEEMTEKFNFDMTGGEDQQQLVNDDDDEYTNLDFNPNSPMVRDTHKATPSPLLTERSKSSPLEREKFSHPEYNREKSSSSPSPAPPTLEELGHEDKSEVPGSPISKASSETSVRGVRFSDEPALPPSQDESIPKEKEKVKWSSKIFGKRPSSARKHKYEEVVLKYVTPLEYDAEGVPPLAEGAPPSINRARSLQVGMDHVGSEQPLPHPPTHSRSTSVQVNDPPKIHNSLLKRQSELTLSSPSKKSESVSGLSPLEEIPSDSNSPSPHLVPTSPNVAPPSGESENEQEEIALVKSLSVSHPVLEIQEEFSWDKTVDRRLYKKMNKAERERQAILHELIQTEKNHFRALHVLKLIFRQQIVKVVSDETLTQLFPELDNLIEISDEFLKRLESKKRPTKDIIIDDLSDVLLEQFSGENHAQMLRSFGVFCSGHLNATEIYKEHMKKKAFSRLMKQLHSIKECQRLTLPDYYLAVSQRLSKLLTLLKRLAKKSESLKLDHAPRVRESLENLEELIAAVDLTVENNKMRMEVEAIQSRLEAPRPTKFKDRQERLNFSLTAQDRRLRKRGMAGWKGHGKDISVHVILVTDMVVLLTERDQRYHLASLLDHKPPVIRLYDLHVRVNVSVKTGVQLLLLEKGNSPEMFRLEFPTKKLAREWEIALNEAIDECKEKRLKCEFFGEECEKAVFGEGEETKKDSDLEDSFSQDTTNPVIRSMQRAREALALASKILTPGTSSTTDLTHSHGIAASVSSNQFSRVTSHDQPSKGRNRSQTTYRPKTYYNDEDLASGGSSATLAGDHVISAPMPPGKVLKNKGEKKKVRLDRSSTFRAKDREKEKSSNVEAESSFRVPEQIYIKCITNLKDSLQEMMNMCEDKDLEIGKLKNEVEDLRNSFQQSLSPEPSPSVQRRLSPRTSPPQPRPHSVHFDHIHNELHSQSESLIRDGEEATSDDDTPNGSSCRLNED